MKSRGMTVRRGALLCLVACAAAGCSERRTPEAKLDLRPRVKTVEACVRPFSDALCVQGSVRVRNSAVVAARVPGTIDAVFVEEGARVTNGAALFCVDRVNLENAVAQARAALASAEAVVGEVEAAVEKATWDDARMARLWEGKAVTKDAFEKARLQLKSVTAKRAAAQAQRTQAAAAVRSAEKNLADSIGRAPFAGVVTRRHRDIGDYAGPGAAVFSLDDPATRELCLSLAAVHYPKVVEGKTRVRYAVAGTNAEAVVSYKAPRVDARTRTFEVRCVLEEPDGVRGAFVPGMILDATVVFRAFTAQAVPEATAGTRGGRTVVFAVREGKVAAVPVETGAHTDGWVEIVSPDLGREALVAEGMLLLNEGEEVVRVSE